MAEFGVTTGGGSVGLGFGDLEEGPPKACCAYVRTEITIDYSDAAVDRDGGLGAGPHEVTYSTNIDIHRFCGKPGIPTIKKLPGGKETGYSVKPPAWARIRNQRVKCGWPDFTARKLSVSPDEFSTNLCLKRGTKVIEEFDEDDARFDEDARSQSASRTWIVPLGTCPGECYRWEKLENQNSSNKVTIKGSYSKKTLKKDLLQLTKKVLKALENKKCCTNDKVLPL